MTVYEAKTFYEAQYDIVNQTTFNLRPNQDREKSPLKPDKRTSNKRKSPSRILNLPPSHIDCTLLKVVSV